MVKLYSSSRNIFYLTIVIFPCCFLFSCENDVKTVEAWTQNKVMTEEAKTVECYLSQRGRMKAKLKAPLMLRVLGDTIYVEFPQTLHVDFYNDSAKIDSWLDAKYGKYFESLNKVYLRDSVVVINTKGDTLRTPELWWDQNTKLLYSNKFTEYYTRTGYEYGRKGMEATQDLKSIKFYEGGGNVLVSDSGTIK